MTGGRPPSDSEDLLTTAQRSRRRQATSTQRIGDRYEVLDQLGRGGMAAVYRVRDIGSGREVALKQLTISSESSRFAEITALFQREFHTLAQLSHPSVIEVYDYGVDAHGPYYTMELLDGGDLTRHAPLPYVRACELLLQVCSSLSLLHSRRWVHRDVTPRNVHCTQGGQAKLIDFGAMVPMGVHVSSIGTPAFTAPEVLQELPLDGRTDLFSLGATLYYALTAHQAFPARSFTDLREAWANEPLPPSSLVPEIPEALDALALSLLRIDPASRPRSAFEVMQRLAAIAGVSEPEPLDISKAYLSTPTLVGRDEELQQFREHWQSALQGHGGALLFEGQPGLGRSRLLDACVLDAKTAGATVLRLAGHAATGAAFSGVRALAAELLRAVPQIAHEHAQGLPEVEAWLTPSAATSGEALAAAEPLRTEAAGVFSAVSTWWKRVSESHPLLIAVDDVEQLDDASLGFLSSLADAAPEMRLLLLASNLAPDSLSALSLLRAGSTLRSLSALTREQTELLFTSIFGGAAHVTLLCERVHAIAAGNPREAMSLAQYMLDVGLLRYADGTWTLPATLSLQDLPNDPDDRLRARLAGLPALARRLLEAQALSLPATFKRAHYAELARGVPAREVREAVDILLRERLLTRDVGAFTLAQSSLANWLSSQLTAAERAERHAALAQTFQRLDGATLHEVYHLLLAEQPGPALTRLDAQLRAHKVPDDFQRSAGMSVGDLALVLTRAHAAALAHGSSSRVTHELGRQLTALSLVTDNKLHARYAPAWLAQLERDSGLCDYRGMPDVGDQGQRLQYALETATARYRSQPEAARVYPIEEAIPNLCWYATLSIAIAARTRDLQLMASLAGLLEPFVSLSPIVHALWQNAISAYEMNFGGQSGRARARALAVFEELSVQRSDKLPYLDTVRNAIAFSLASIELSLGHASASHWIELLDADPLQRVNAMYLRRMLCIYRGDAEGADYFRRQAELLSLQASARQMFAVPLRRELMAQLQLGDLAAVKQVTDQIAEMSTTQPGWVAQHSFAVGMYQRLRGDLEAARTALEEALTAADANADYSTWIAAVSGYVSVLVELQQAEEARKLGQSALARCAIFEIDVEAVSLRRELALAEARCGDFESATARIEALMAERAELMETHRALDYEARACIALWAGDPQAGEHLAKVASLQLSLGRGAAFLRRYPRLLEDARRSGVQLLLSPTAFETSLRLAAPANEVRTEAEAARAELQSIPDLSERARRALELLARAADAQSARLYLFVEGGLMQVASMNLDNPAGLDAFVSTRWLQLSDTAELSTASTIAHSNAAEDEPEWTAPDGTPFRLLFLPRVGRLGAPCLGVCALGNARRWITTPERLLSAEISAVLEIPDTSSGHSR